jgi:hypothetical protein
MSVTLSSCGREPITAWDSPQMLAAKREWDFLLKNPPPEERPSKNSELIKAQQAILNRILSKDAIHRLAATCDTLPVHERALNGFDLHVLERIVIRFIKDGDRESLVSVFSKRYPEYLGPELPTVTYLLCHPHPQFTDPILIFGDAYLRCTEPEVRSRIADAVRMAFAGLPIPGETDTEFVVNAMQLYVKEKDRLVPYLRDVTPGKGYFRMKESAEKSP